MVKSKYPKTAALLKDRVKKVKKGIIPQPLASHGYSAIQIQRDKEIKEISISLFTSAFNAAAAITPINLILAGTLFNSRVGDKVNMIALRVRGKISNTWGSAANQTVQSYARLCVVYDSQANGTAASWPDMFQSLNQYGQTDNSAYAGVNLDYRDRFKVLIDKRYNLPNIVTGSYGAGQRSCIYPRNNELIVDEYRKLRLPTTFQTSSGTIGDIANGSLLLVTIANTTTYWQATLDTQVKFQDV